MTDAKELREAAAQLDEGVAVAERWPEFADKGDLLKLAARALRAWAEIVEPGEALIEAMARAHDTEDAAQKGEPTPWQPWFDESDFADFRAERFAAMRPALSAIAAHLEGE